ncbi:hypothetical protein [Miniphocaeibacter massiliensis]|uniref:hypothetical protein n=1 Tax=Miniphocaeibacter massiliensis TaxID=2041841 RepID=UPI000C1C77E7|nr:hypothetical protein [Miniphocaeibacter massiliensis]
MVFFIMGGIFALVIGYSIICNKRYKEYFEDESGEKAKMDLEMKQRLIGILLPLDPKIQEKNIVNGHFIKQVSLVLKVTTYYSYAIVFTDDKDSLLLYEYSPEEEKASLIGEFSLEQLSMKEISPYQINYLFHDVNGKLLHSVQVYNQEIPDSNDYEIKYSQSKEFEKLREKVGD